MRIDEALQDHALEALGYLRSKLDARYLARLRGKETTDGPIEVDDEILIRERRREALRAIYNTPLGDEDDGVWSPLPGSGS